MIYNDAEYYNNRGLDRSDAGDRRGAIATHNWPELQQTSNGKCDSLTNLCRYS